jgi:hypothetical protein
VQDLIADLFGGSGSTLIACKRRGRKARLMEIDPIYADCIVQRCQEYTGKQAVLEDRGGHLKPLHASGQGGGMNSTGRSKKAARRGTERHL